MPFIDHPIFCSSCQGTGKIRPICAFKVHEDVLMTECLNCRGVGTVTNKVYINPPASTSIQENTQVADPIIIDDLNTSEELKKTQDAISTIKYSKKTNPAK